MSIDVREVIRSADGFTTLRYDVVNDTPDDASLAEVHAFRSREDPAISLFDPAGGVRYQPIVADGSSGGCLCTYGGVEVPSQGTLSAYVTFGGVDAEVDAVRVEIGGMVPVEDVPVVRVGPFEPAPSHPLVVETDPDLEITVDGVVPGADGTTVLAMTYRNATSPEPIDLDRFPTPRP